MRLDLRHTLHLVAFTSVISACSTTKTDRIAETEKPGTSPGLCGVWKSDGYGFVFVANADTLQAYEVTQTTCVPSTTSCSAMARCRCR